MPRSQQVSPGMPNSQGQREPGKTLPPRKRNRYVLHACNRCRAAKVRCDGRLPCTYCVARNPDTCYYSTRQLPNFQNEPVRDSTPPSTIDDGSFQVAVSTLLQQQNDKLDMLINRIMSLERVQGQPLPLNADKVPSLAEQPLPLFQSSTSALFCISVIDTNLKALEHSVTGSPREESSPSPPYTNFSIVQGQIVDEVSGDVAEEEFDDVPFTHLPGIARKDGRTALVQPLDSLGCSDVIRLVHQYQDLVGMMYPILDIEYMVQRTQELWATSAEKGLEKDKLLQIDRKEVALLKMMVAVAMISEGKSHCELARSLYESLWLEVEAMIWNTKVDLKGLILLILVTLYYYHSNKWRLAWRFLGNIVRIILELGLNHQIVVDRFFPHPKSHSQAINTIWSVFVLQQKLSYSLGLSVAMQDLRLDPSFPRPVEAPYLEAMIQYARIGAQACDALLGEKDTGYSGLSNQQEAFLFFEYRLEEWRKGITKDFQFRPSVEKTNIWNKQLCTMLNLRANHLRLVIARSFLYENRTTRAAPLDIWTYSMDVAADTIQILADLDSSTVTYRFHQAQTDHFLITALGIWLLAITQDSSNHMSPSLDVKRISMTAATYLKVQQSAMVALNLLYSRAESSRHSQCLWERVRGLAFRLHLLNCLIPVADGTSSPGPEERILTGAAPNAAESITNHRRPTETEDMTSLVSIMLDVNTSGLRDLNEFSPSAIGITPDLDTILDPSFLAGGF